MKVSSFTFYKAQSVFDLTKLILHVVVSGPRNYGPDRTRVKKKKLHIVTRFNPNIKPDPTRNRPGTDPTISRPSTH